MTEHARFASPLRRAVSYTLIYAAIGIVWVALSDTAVEGLSNNPRTVAVLHTIKGWLFIAITAAALFFLLWNHSRIDAQRLAAYRHQQGEIEALNRFQTSIIESPEVWINTINTDGEITLWNDAAEQISGYARSEVLGHGHVWEWLYPDPDYREWVVDKASRIIEGGQARRLETRIRRQDGQERDIEWYSRALTDSTDTNIGAVAFGVDVTRLKTAQRALEERERELSALMANLPGMAYHCRDDNARTMLFISHGCEELTGYTADELLTAGGTSYRDIIIDHPTIERSDIRERIDANESYALEYRIRRRDGGIAWALERGSPVTLGNERALEGIILDITDRKRMEQELHELATRDQLTGLYNRRTMDGFLRDELVRAHRYDRPFALLWLDLDHFKHINDDYGHQIGDRILQHVCRRLSENLRTTDYLARYGGEELIVALPELPLDEALKAGERLRAAIADDPFQPDTSGIIPLTVSVGVASYPEHGHDLDQLYRAADNAMYHSKQSGRNAVTHLKAQGAAASQE
jgi:diguanylate cyclase (GGDEF)-like protein/PAS domain S-box-containing protein